MAPPLPCPGHRTRRRGGAGPEPDATTPVADTAPVALFFGTWTAYKGIDVLLDAFEHVRAERPDAELVMAGAVGADVDLPAVLARAESIGNVTTTTGYIPTDQVARIVGSARLLVTPYVRASQSGVVHLAYTFGRPVVTTEVGDLAEAVHDGENGLLVPPQDPAALAAAMLKLLTDPQLAAALGAAGHEHVAGAWQRTADRRRRTEEATTP